MTPEEFKTVQQTIRAVCAAFDNKGPDFEHLCEDLIRGLGFVQVQQQNSGIQFGRDFSAFRDTDRGRERWFFECKNLADNVTAALAAAKLIHHFDRRNLYAFVIMGPSQLSNELRDLLERNPFPFPVFDWTADSFVKAVLVVESVRHRWFPTITVVPQPNVLAAYRRDLLEVCLPPAADPLEVRIEPRNQPPYQMAYFLREGELFEYTTDFEYEHRVMLHNRGRSAMLVTSIAVTTLSCEPLPDRLLVQMKMKGEYNPLHFAYSPASTGSSVELLAPRMRQLQPGETELHFMKLVGCSPGIYRLRVTATYVYEGQSTTTDATDLTLCACADVARPDSQQHLRLQTWRGHYRAAARIALARPQAEWKLIASVAAHDRILFLGPVPNAEIGRGPDRSVRARITIVPLVVDSDGATLKLEEASELCDWGDAVGDVAPGDPLVTARSHAELHGITVEEYMRRRWGS